MRVVDDSDRDGCLEVQKWETQLCFLCMCVCERERTQAHCVHINAALRKFCQTGSDGGQLRLPGA